MPRQLVSLSILLLAFSLRIHRATILGAQSDEGVHITAAEQLASGSVLYRELFENRTPGVEWILAVFFRLTIPDLIFGRLLTIFVTTLTVAALIPAGRALYDLLVDEEQPGGIGRQLAGWTAALFFALAPLTVFWARFTMLEHWQTLAATLAILCALIASSRNGQVWWFFSGVMAAVAFSAKQSAIAIIVILGLYVALEKSGRGWKQRYRTIGAWILGLSLSLLTLLTILIFQGSLGNFVEFVSGAELLAPSNEPLAKLANGISWVIRRPFVLLAIFGVLFVLQKRRLAGFLVVTWAAVETGLLLLPKELDLGWGGFSHYALTAIAAVCLLAGIGAMFLYRYLRDRSHYRLVASLLIVALVAMSVPWLIDLDFAVRRSNYPQPDSVDEKNIGRALSALTEEDEPVLVLANSIFYHYANRQPNNVFFHYPGFLADSALLPIAKSDIADALADKQTGALAISRMHLEERIDEDIIQAIWKNWIPAARFPYSYQRDVFIFTQRPAISERDQSSLVLFDPGIELAYSEARILDQQTLLVRLDWLSDVMIEEELSTFVHLLAPDGRLVAQHDGIPGVGFRPVSTWTKGETIIDLHWLEIPSDINLEDHRLVVGLYNTATGDRMPLSSEPGIGDAYQLTDIWTAP